MPLFSSNIPRADVLIPGSLALTVDIDRPDSSDVSLVCSETLSIVREPGIDDVILGHREEQIALTVVFDLRQ